nr:unnamed protein product [Digitaria exilis]
MQGAGASNARSKRIRRLKSKPREPRREGKRKKKTKQKKRKASAPPWTPAGEPPHRTAPPSAQRKQAERGNDSEPRGAEQLARPRCVRRQGGALPAAARLQDLSLLAEGGKQIYLLPLWGMLASAGHLLICLRGGYAAYPTFLSPCWLHCLGDSFSTPPIHRCLTPREKQPPT